MNGDGVESQLLSLFGALSPQHKRELERLLDHPIGRRAFQKLIESALDLQNRLGSNRADDYSEIPRHAVQSSDYYFEAGDPIRQSFTTLLWDKKMFPKTDDVISVVRHFFGVKLDPARFRKSGRKAVIAQTWRFLSELSQRDRVERLRKFFSEFASRLDPHRSYRELFRILSRSE